MRNFKYEKVEAKAGIYFPAAKVFATGTYFSDVNGRDAQEHKNLLVDEGLIAMLTDFLANGTSYASFYLALYSGNYTPTAALTGASFAATAGEVVSGSEGYSNTTRPLWTPSGATNDAIDNVANKAAFNIVTASSLTLQGAALMSSSTKGAVSGICVSATKFTAARVVYNTDVFNLAYRVQLSST